MLIFEKQWRFDSPGPLPREAVIDFNDLISRIVGQSRDRKGMLEFFKGYFAGPAGRVATSSSSEDWAQSDLNAYVWDAAENAPLFIEAFYDACQSLERSDPNLALPDVQRMNRVLFERETGWQIQLPRIICTIDQPLIAAPERVASLSEQAQAKIFASLAESDRLLAEGRGRPAVQEVLWLLESVVTAFQGLEVETGTVQGKYFNKIADDLRGRHRGRYLEQVLAWMKQLHGYLSSPTGGGVRHGADLQVDIDLQQHEAKLYCNLIRSYVSFLLSEHERMSAVSKGSNG